MVVVIIAWIVAISLWDLRYGEVPNWLTLPVIAGGLLLRVAWGLPVVSWAIIVVAYATFAALWRIYAMGGGSAKFNMALYTLLPFPAFVVMQLLVVTGVFAAILAIGLIRGNMVMGRQFLHPSVGLLNQYGLNVEWAWGLAGVLYVLRA